MDSVLIDSDVFIDVLLAREPFGIHSSKILNLCDKRRIYGFTTAVIISNVYYIAAKESTSRKVKGKINEILKMIAIIDIPKKVILDALSSKFIDFEDAMQNYAAEHNGKISTILTRNLKDYKHSQLKVMTPEGYLGSIF